MTSVASTPTTGRSTPTMATSSSLQLPPSRFTETKFSESFWSNSRGDYVTGIQVLHSKADQGAVEDQEIISYLRERIDVEQRYGNALIDMGNRRLKMEGFLRDEGASLRKTFETMKTESIKLGNGHLTMASNLRELVLNPLLKFTSQARQSTQQSREELETRLGLFDRHLLDLDRSYATYVGKCNASERADIEAAKIAQEEASADMAAGAPADGDPRRHEFAQQRFTMQELSTFLQRMKNEVSKQDYRVPILGLYTDCCTGSAIAHWIQQNTKARTIQEAEHIGQSLADEGFLRLIGQRGNKFLASPANFYQWRDQMFEMLEDDEKEDDLSEVKKAKQEVEKADASYLNAVKRADQTRMQLEVNLFGHMDLLQRYEFDRISTFKNAFLNFAAIFSNIIGNTQSVADNLLIFQEALRPQNDVQYVIEQYRTGAFVPMPTLYNNFYHGTGVDQVFGVNIEKHCNFTRKKVPQLVSKCLARIKKSSVALTNEQKLACWTAEVPLADIHVLRNKINHGGKVTQKLLRLFDLATVVGVLRLYFLELPGSLINGEDYETVKIIYSSVSEDMSENKNDARISSIRNLLALMSIARFYTLYEVVKHISGLIKETETSDSFVNFVAHRWGPVLLRPLEETAVTMFDKHPQRMMRDMLQMTHQIFTPIVMSREDGSLSRSSTQRLSQGPKIQRTNARASRDYKNAPPGTAAAKRNSGGNSVPTIAVEGNVEATSPKEGGPAEESHGAGVGVGSPAPANVGAKQRRFGPSSTRFNLTRGVSAPEMFTEMASFRKKVPSNDGAAEGGATADQEVGAGAPGMLNTTGLKVAAGGEKSSRSPLRTSMSTSIAAEEIQEEQEEPDEEDAEAEAEAEAAPQPQEQEQISTEEAIPVSPETEEATPSISVQQDESPVAIAAGEENAESAAEQDWKAVSGAEFESGGRKLERRRVSRQSRLSTHANSSSDISVNGLSAESLLQAMRDDNPETN